MERVADTMYLHGKLLISIVQRKLGNVLVSTTKEAGARGGTILIGKGVANNAMLHALGLGDSDKDIVFTILKNQEVSPVLEALAHFREKKRLNSGIAMLIDVPDLLSHFTDGEKGEIEMKETPNNYNESSTLIVSIVNKGFADEIMDTLRKEGATGGTIINGSGTGKEEDVKFFGVQLVPEKELLLVVVEKSKTQHILKTIQSIPLLAEPGTGIAFCIDVEKFITLGGNRP
jgi:nitrogen regulatory protein PII